MKKGLAVFRTALGVLFVLTALPPMSVGLFRLVEFFLPAVGVLLIFWPRIKQWLRRMFGGGFPTALRALYVAAGVFALFFLTELAVILSGSLPQTPPESCTLVVLGAKVNGTQPTLDLQGRIEAAAAFLKSHPGVKCVASGGKGGDEGISEARCIRNTLVSQYGIAANRVYLDENSYNTIQNIQNTIRILHKNGLPGRAALVTDGYHMFRARLLASRCGLAAYACPAKTDPRLWAPFYVREVFALPKSLLFDRP